MQIQTIKQRFITNKITKEIKQNHKKDLIKKKAKKEGDSNKELLGKIEKKQQQERLKITLTNNYIKYKLPKNSFQLQRLQD